MLGDLAEGLSAVDEAVVAAGDGVDCERSVEMGEVEGRERTLLEDRVHDIGGEVTVFVGGEPVLPGGRERREWGEGAELGG